MKGTDKQIAWAKDIINTWVPVWNEAYANYSHEAFEILKSGIEKAESKGREKMAQRKREDLEMIVKASDIMENIESLSAEEIIDNRSALQLHGLAKGLGKGSNELTVAARFICESFSK